MANFTPLLTTLAQIFSPQSKSVLPTPNDWGGGTDGPGTGGFFGVNYQAPQQFFDFTQPTPPLPQTQSGGVTPPIGGGNIFDLGSFDDPFSNPRQPQYPQVQQPQLRENRILDEFVRHSNNAPVNEKPSLWRLLGTMAYSAARRGPITEQESISADGRRSKQRTYRTWNPLSFGEAQEILDYPNKQRLEDWKVKGAGLKEAAAAEDRRLQQESLAQARLRNADTAEARERRLTTTFEGKMELDKLKLELENWKARNPKGQVFVQRGGNVWIINPVTGEATDTQIPSGLMSQEELQRLVGQQRIDQINTQGLIRDAQQKRQFQYGFDLEEKRHENDLEEIDRRNQGRGQTGQYPTQDRVAMQTKVASLLAMNPNWRTKLGIDPTTYQPTVVRPQSEEPAEWKEYWNIVAAVYGPNAVPPGPRAEFGIGGGPSKDIVLGANGQIPTPQIPQSMNKPGRKWRHDSRGNVQYSDDGGRTWLNLGAK